MMALEDDPYRTDDEPALPVEGRFTILPEDDAEERRVRFGWVWTIAPAALVALGSYNLVQAWRNPSGTGAHPLVTIVVGFAWLFYLHGPIRARTAKPDPRGDLTVSLDDEAITFTDSLGNAGRLVWRNFTAYRRSPHGFFLRGAGIARVLPRRAWQTEAEYARVVELVEAHVAPATRGWPIKSLLVNAILLVMVAGSLWQFFAGGPR